MDIWIKAIKAQEIKTEIIQTLNINRQKIACMGQVWPKTEVKLKILLTKIQNTIEHVF